MSSNLAGGDLDLVSVERKEALDVGCSALGSLVAPGNVFGCAVRGVRGQTLPPTGGGGGAHSHEVHADRSRRELMRC